MPGELLAHLRQRAVTLVETELPTVEELRSVVGALVHVIEEIAGDEIDRLAPVEPPDTGEDATPPVTSAAPVPAVAPVAEVPATVEPAGQPPMGTALTGTEQAQLDYLLQRAQANAEPAPTDPPLDPAAEPVEPSPSDEPTTEPPAVTS